MDSAIQPELSGLNAKLQSPSCGRHLCKFTHKPNKTHDVRRFKEAENSLCLCATFKITQISKHNEKCVCELKKHKFRLCLNITETSWRKAATFAVMKNTLALWANRFLPKSLGCIGTYGEWQLWHTINKIKKRLLKPAQSNWWVYFLCLWLITHLTWWVLSKSYTVDNHLK